MKKLLIVTIAIVLSSCGSRKRITQKQSVETQVKTNANTLGLISEKSIKSNLEYLASDALEGRSTGTKGIEKAAAFIEDYFKKNNVKPYFKTYRDSFNLKDIVGYNIVGLVEGNDAKLKNEFIILGAHYDHIGAAKAVNGDTIANGANDDASGTVAVMEWAAYFAKFRSNKRSILFTLYSAEEMGLKGSEHLANKLKKEDLNLYTMINFEMIGVPRAKEETMAYLSGYEKSNLAKKLNEYAGKELVGLFTKAKQFQLFKRSDNYPFYKAFKVPAHAISTFDFTNFDYYHHVDDEADKMDFKHMAALINQMIPAIEGMANSVSKEIKMNDE